ncbi:MAG TPA: IPTL-CTERM sorting domain-containing protein [Thermoanaerobaculia bacterium]|nr:IPTL-CTERM sorting domain-containing protein [Thermoanaerobaculia bacterium]
MTASTPFRHIALALVAGLALAGATLAQPAPGTLLGSTGNAGNSLISVDTATGTGTFLCELGEYGPVTEIRHRADGVLFATTGQGSSNLITIDAGACTETLVGEHQYGAVNALAFAGNTLYGAFFAPPNGPEGVVPVYLVTVDTATAQLTLIDELPYDRVRGMAYDAATATMYGVGTTLQEPPPPTEGEPADELFTVDLGTAATTPVGSTGQSLGALAFSADGTLYAGEAISGGPGEGVTGARLFTLDPATGAATAVGFTDFPAVSGLSFVPGGTPGPGPSVLEIPTLGPAGLAGLGLLLAGGAVALLRRRRG